MRTLAIIPARGGSRRLPGKNILPLGGLPLLAHSIRFAQGCKSIDEVVVSTDSKDIRQVALQYGARVVDRPAAISGDNEPTVTALQHALEQTADPVDNVVLLQPTNPLRPGGMFEQCWQLYQEQQADCVFTVSRSHRKLGRIDNGRFIPWNYTPGQRSQDLEPLFYENGLLYLCRATTIKSGRIITENSLPLVVDHAFGDVDIDTKEDFDLAEFLYGKYS